MREIIIRNCIIGKVVTNMWISHDDYLRLTLDLKTEKSISEGLRLKLNSKEFESLNKGVTIKSLQAENDKLFKKNAKLHEKIDSILNEKIKLLSHLTLEEIQEQNNILIRKHSLLGGYHVD